MHKIKIIVLFLMLGLFLTACGSDRAGNNKITDANGSVLGVVELDTDGDGISDVDEENIYGTNPESNDTDGDGLLDAEEINIYDTNATNADTDNDGLNDGLEVHRLGTNATNSDTDGDGLLDGEEINIYDTNVSNSDTDNDGLTDALEINTYYTNATNPDTDGDGLTDGAEINSYETNATNADTDGDGLTDGEEINSYDTNATNADTDNDGLTDALEINTYDTNATNADTDGDCLLDGFEVFNYETNASNKDTDKDGVEDGIEIYGSLTTECLDNGEILTDGAKSPVAIDNIQRADIIDALDPTNDSDGDTQSNIKELECAEGNPKDANKKCPTIEETEVGNSLVTTGFIYVPGGFDVDGDGVNEKGFWISSYHARTTGVKITAGIVNNGIGKFNTYIQKNFFMVNATSTISPVIHGYSDESLSDTLMNEPIPIGKELEFSVNLNPQIKKRISGMMPFMGTFSLSLYKVYDNQQNDLNLSLTFPNLKQYAQIQKLLKADKEEGGTGDTIRNGLLGVDINVPIITYAKIIHEFGEGYKEYLNSIMQMKEGSIIVCVGCPWVKPWMGINKERLVKNPNEIAQDGSPVARGADANINVGMGVGSKVDDYGVLVRAGEVLDLTVGVTGATSDQIGSHDGIGFRAATAYVE